jgi:hypothetical protein
MCGAKREAFQAGCSAHQMAPSSGSPRLLISTAVLAAAPAGINRSTNEYFPHGRRLQVNEGMHHCSWMRSLLYASHSEAPCSSGLYLQAQAKAAR